MKLNKKIVTVLLGSTLLLAACSGGKSAKETEGDAATKDASGKYSPVLTITAAKQLDENAGLYDKGDDINNNPMIRLGEEKLGIKIDTTLLGGDFDNYTTKLRLALTGSEKLPDVVPVYDKQMISDLIESGRVKAIDDEIEKYMPDRLKKIYDNFPESFYPVTKDGKTYGFANVPYLEPTQVMLIRQDWLDNLGLEAPTNMEEFGEVIKAFTENDPDGNGKKDTYGFTYAGDSIYNTGWVSDPVMLFSANSGKMIPGSWQKDENGDLKYGSIDEGNKATLETMAEWHKSGYLFKEAAATNAWDAMAQFTEGKAGIIMGRPWVITSVNDLTLNNPDAKIEAYPTIRQDNGEPTYHSAQTNDGWLLFNEDFNDMEAFFEYYDWLYDIAFGTGDFEYGFLQGYDYDIVNGQAVFDSTKFDPPVDTPFQPGKSLITKNTPAIDTMAPFYNVLIAGKEDNAKDVASVTASFEMNPAQARAYALAYEHQEELIPNLHNGAPTETGRKSWEQLETLEKELYTNIIYGKQDASAFDDFVQKWKAQGGDQVTKEVNQWYKEISQ